MTIYFLANPVSFYDANVNPTIPAGAISISNDLYQSLLEGQKNGKIIEADAQGNPILVDPPAPSHDFLIQQCIEQAHQLLIQTDWSQNADVQPNLVNLSEFTAYRAIVRDILLNPVEAPVFPTQPKAVWSF